MLSNKPILRKMDLKLKAKEELESRVKAIEELIENKGLGSKYLKKARKTQRLMNLTVLAGVGVVVVSLATWAALNRE